MDQLAILGVTSDDDRTTELTPISKESLLHIEAQPRLATSLIRPVTSETVLRQQGTHLTGKIDRPCHHRSTTDIRCSQVVAPHRACIDPLPDHLYLVSGQRPSGGHRWHATGRRFSGQPLKQRTPLGISRQHGTPDKIACV